MWSAREAREARELRRAERRRRRSRRGVGLRALVTVGLGWVTATTGVDPGVELSEIFAGLATVAAGLSTAEAAHRMWRLHRGPRVLEGGTPPPPPVGSAARAPLERLAARERALADLLAVLDSDAADLAAEVRSQAAEAASALRDHARRIVTIESARAGAPATAVAGLDSALGALGERLEEAVSCYDQVVTAAADAVSAASAGSTGHGAVLHRLRDASDALFGLAGGLREVAGTDPTPAG